MPSQKPSYLKVYYTSHLDDSLRAWKRSKPIALALLIIHLYWRLCLITPILPTSSNELSFDYIARYSLLFETTTNAHIYSSLAVNAAFVLLMILDIASSAFFKQQQQQLQQKHIMKSIITKSISLSLSVLSQIYSYLFFIPQMYHAFNYVSTSSTGSLPIAIATLASTFFIQLFISLHDQDYSFQCEDYLDRRNSFQWDIVSALLEGASAGFLAISDEREGIYIFGIFLSAFTLVSNYENLPYSDAFVKQMHTSGQLFCVSISSALLISTLAQFVVSYQNFIVAIILIPISIKLASTILEMPQNLDLQTLQAIAQHQYSYRTDNLLRELCKSSERLHFDDYITWPRSHLIESIIAHHNTTCTFFPNCFCIEMQADYLNQKQMIPKAHRHKYLMDFIEEIFVGILKKNKKHLGRGSKVFDFLAHYSFIYFLIEKKHSKVFAFKEIFTLLSRAQSISFRQHFFLNRMLKSVRRSFSSPLQQQQQYQASYDMHAVNEINHPHQSQIPLARIPTLTMNNNNNNNNNNNYKAQQMVIPNQPAVFASSNLKMNSNANDSPLNFIVGIEYDEKMNAFQSAFIAGVKQKLYMLTIISGEFIDLNSMQQSAHDYLALRTHLDSELKQLCRMNCFGQKIQFLIHDFIELFAFVQKRSEFLLESLQGSFTQPTTEQQIKGLAYSKSVKNSVFSKDVCIVFVSLIGKSGVIQRAQNKLERFFGWKLHEAIGKNIEILMPQFVSQSHDAILRDFIYDKKQTRTATSADSVDGKVHLALAKTREGWAIPVSTRLKISTFGMDCGVCAEIKQIRSENSFIMTSGESFFVQIMSQILYTSVLSKYFSESEIHKLHMLRAFPALHLLQQAQIELSAQQQQSAQTEPALISHIEWQQSFAVLPKKREKYKKKRDLFFRETDGRQFTKQLTVNQLLLQYDVYLITLRIHTNRNPYFHFNILEIDSMQRLTDFNEINLIYQAFQKEADRFYETFRPIAPASIAQTSSAAQLAATTTEINSFTKTEGLSSFVHTLRSSYANESNNSSSKYEKQKSLSKPTNILQKQKPKIAATTTTVQDLIQEPVKLNNTTMIQNRHNDTSVDNESQFFQHSITEQLIGLTSSQHRLVVKPTSYQAAVPLTIEESAYSLTSRNISSAQLLYQNEQTNRSDDKAFNFLHSLADKQPSQLKPEIQIFSENEVPNIEFAAALAFPPEIEQESSSQQQQQQQQQQFVKPLYHPSGRPIHASKFAEPDYIEESENNKVKQTKMNGTLFRKQESHRSGSGELVADLQSRRNPQKHHRNRHQNSPNSNDNEIEQFSNSNNNNDSISEQSQKRSMRLTFSSFNSRSSANYESQRLVKQAILSPTQSVILSSLRFIGSAALLLLQSLTLYLMFIVENQVEIVNLCGQYTPWPMNVRASIVQILRQEGLLRLSDTGIFPQLSTEAFRTKQTAIALSDVSHTLKLYHQYIFSEIDKLSFFQITNTESVQFSWTKDESTLSDKVTKLASTKYTRDYIIGQILPFHALIYSQLPRRKPDEQIYMMSIIDNFPTLSPKLGRIQDAIRELAIEKIDKILSESTWLLIGVILVAGILITSVFPVYYFVQKHIEALNQLFATIQTPHLKSMIQPALFFLNGENAMKQTLFPEKYIKKRKAITETSRLVKFQLKFVIYGVICFCAVLIQPITTQLIISSFRTQSVASLDLLRNIYGIKALFTSNLGLYFEYLYKALVPSALFYNIAYFEKRFPELAIQNETQLKQMYSFINAAHTTTNYEKDLFDGFLFQILEGNICQALKQYPQYMSTENNITQTECESYQKGLLKSGFQINVKSFISVFADMQSIFDLKDSTVVYEEIISWEKELNLFEFNEYSTCLFKIVDIMRDFMLSIIDSQMEQMLLIQKLLVSFQMISLALVFIKGWIEFYRETYASITTARHLLSILSIDVILENPYIQSFISKEKQFHII